MLYLLKIYETVNVCMVPDLLLRMYKVLMLQINSEVFKINLNPNIIQRSSVFLSMND